MSTRKKMRIRLALREEGRFWNAYLAPIGTMEGAKLIGSIATGAAKKNPTIKAMFMSLMQLVVADAVEEVTGVAPTIFDVQRAPESERAGHS